MPVQDNDSMDDVSHLTVVKLLEKTKNKCKRAKQTNRADNASHLPKPATEMAPRSHAPLNAAWALARYSQPTAARESGCSSWSCVRVRNACHVCGRVFATPHPLAHPCFEQHLFIKNRYVFVYRVPGFSLNTYQVEKPPSMVNHP